MARIRRCCFGLAWLAWVNALRHELAYANEDGGRVTYHRDGGDVGDGGGVQVDGTLAIAAGAALNVAAVTFSAVHRARMLLRMSRSSGRIGRARTPEKKKNFFNSKNI